MRIFGILSKTVDVATFFSNGRIARRNIAILHGYSRDAKGQNGVWGSSNCNNNTHLIRHGMNFSQHCVLRGYGHTKNSNFEESSTNANSNPDTKILPIGIVNGNPAKFLVIPFEMFDENEKSSDQLILKSLKVVRKYVKEIDAFMKQSNNLPLQQQQSSVIDEHAKLNEKQTLNSSLVTKLPDDIESKMKAMAISSMELAFVVDMDSIKKALINSAKETDNENFAPTLSVETKLQRDSLMNTNTIPLNFNAHLKGKMEMDSDKLSAMSMELENSQSGSTADTQQEQFQDSEAANHTYRLEDLTDFNKSLTNSTKLRNAIQSSMTNKKITISSYESMQPKGVLNSEIMSESGATFYAKDKKKCIPLSKSDNKSENNKKAQSKKHDPCKKDNKKDDPCKKKDDKKKDDPCKKKKDDPCKKKDDKKKDDPCKKKDDKKKDDPCKKKKDDPCKKKDDKKKDDPCKKKDDKKKDDPCKKKKDDPCKKKDDKKKDDPCKKKKDDPCKKKDDKKKDDPCKKKDDKKKDDPCKKKKDDPCKKKDDKKKDDPCKKKDDKKKDDPCKKKKDDPCKKKDDKKKDDPCKKKKDDPCKKKDDKKKDDPCKKKKDDPCKKKDDKKKDDPCKKKDDKKKDDPCKKKKDDPCKKKDDKKKDDPCKKKKDDPCKKKDDKKKNDPCKKKDDKKKNDPCKKKKDDPCKKKDDKKKDDPCKKKDDKKKDDPCKKKTKSIKNDKSCGTSSKRSYYTTTDAKKVAAHLPLLRRFSTYLTPKQYFTQHQIAKKQFAAPPTSNDSLMPKPMVAVPSFPIMLRYKTYLQSKCFYSKDSGKCNTHGTKKKRFDIKARRALIDTCFSDGEGDGCDREASPRCKEPEDSSCCGHKQTGCKQVKHSCRQNKKKE